MICVWKPLPPGGYQCERCGFFSWTNQDRECPGGQILSALATKKPCNCGDTRLKALSVEQPPKEYKIMSDLERDNARRAFRHRQQRRKQERLEQQLKLKQL